MIEPSNNVHNRLKPCPFCGNFPYLYSADQDMDGMFIPSRIYCPVCNATMWGDNREFKYNDKGLLIGGWLSEEELKEYDEKLIKRWNKRVGEVG